VAGVDGDATDPSGTMLKGFAGFDGDLIASDATVVASNLTTYQDYIDSWNNTLVGYEAGISRTIFFAKSIDIDPSRCCPDNCGCTSDGVFIKNTFLSETELLPFNTPSYSYDVLNSNRSKKVTDL
jgi:hypothetical protein